MSTNKVKEYKGSFGEAFRAAEKAGDKQFRWYNPKSKQIEIFAVKHKEPNAKSVNTFKISNQQKQAQKNKQLVVKKKNDANVEYLDAGNLGELTVTAARTKLKGNEQGFIPITSRTDLVDFEGKPRLYQNYTTGEYFVVDNYGNVIGKSTDSNVEKIGFNQFRKADGSLTDLKERGSVELTAQANRNEANQLSKQKLQRQILGEEGLKKDIQTARSNFATTIANIAGSSMTIPEHAVLGGLKVGMSAKDSYTLKDYKKGFNPVDGGSSHIYGLGSFLGLQNPYARFVGDFLGNFTTATTAVRALNPTKITGETKQLIGYNARKLPAGEAGRGIKPGSVKKGGQYFGRYTVPNEAGTAWHSTSSKNRTFMSWSPIRNKNHGWGLQSKFSHGNRFMPDGTVTFEPIHNVNTQTLTYRTPLRTVYGNDLEYKTSELSQPIQSNPKQYEYDPGVPNPWIEKGYANPWNSDKPYIPVKINNGRVDVTNSYGFNTPSYSGETIGSGGFNSRQWPQLKTF